ncbi:gcvH [Symbiodinium sp. KB8]|nr:gcvH [Symbiodinium sp. KB8]
MLGRATAAALAASRTSARWAPQSRWMSTIFTPNHEYAKIDGDVATLGVTNYAQEQLGDVVYVGLPEVGATFEEGDAIAQVESVKAASDVYAVMSGEVVEVNSNLESNPELVNSSPEEDGWFVKLKVTSQPTGEVLDAEAYAALVESA